MIWQILEHKIFIWNKHSEVKRADYALIELNWQSVDIVKKNSKKFTFGPLYYFKNRFINKQFSSLWREIEKYATETFEIGLKFKLFVQIIIPIVYCSALSFLCNIQP